MKSWPIPKNIKIILLLLVIATIFGYFFYKDSLKWKTYTSTKAAFTLQYPSSMKIEESAEQQIDSVNFKKQPVKVIHGGITLTGDPGELDINYGVPWIEGKGGGCDEKDHSNFKFLGTVRNICIGEDYFSLIYENHPQAISQIAIRGKFNKPFEKNKEIIFKMLSTFKFTTQTFPVNQDDQLKKYRIYLR